MSLRWPSPELPPTHRECDGGSQRRPAVTCPSVGRRATRDIARAFALAALAVLCVVAVVLVGTHIHT